MRFVKKPIVVTAVQWTGLNSDELARFTSDAFQWHPVNGAGIDTLEGFMSCSIDDWVIQGVQGEFYPCKPDIFLDSYDVVECSVCDGKGWYDAPPSGIMSEYGLDIKRSIRCTECNPELSYHREFEDWWNHVNIKGNKALAYTSWTQGRIFQQSIDGDKCNE